MVRRDPRRFEYIRAEIERMAAEDPLARELLRLAGVKGHSAPARLALYFLWLLQDPKRMRELTLYADSLRGMVRVLSDMARRGVKLPDYETFVRRLRELDLGPEQMPNLLLRARSVSLEEVM